METSQSMNNPQAWPPSDGRVAGLGEIGSGADGLRAAVETLRDRVQRALAHGWPRVEVELEGVDPLAFLAAQRPGQRSFFRARDGLLAVAMVGQALSGDRIGDRAIREFLSAVPEARGFAALRFDAAREPGREWSAFDAGGVAIPAVELVRQGVRTFLAANLAGDGKATLEVIDRLNAGEAGRVSPRAATDGSDAVDSSPQAWRIAVEATLEAIAKGAVRKVVLARTRSFRLRTAIDPCAMLARLAASEPDTYQFLVEPVAGAAFLGASPERLFRRTGREVESEAVAGTRRRGETPERDAALAAELLASEKDRHEQGLVLNRIVERLAALAGDVTVAGSPRLLRLAHVQHLRSLVSATLGDDDPAVADAALLAALHPTPAVCGLPTEKAHGIIRACEPFDRGLYAGPVGLFGADTEFCVAIRSALVAGRTVTAFAGAGIVAGSAADAEWRETELKLATFGRLVRPG
jgi:menaquinone-specific isochorismate synthase